MLAVKGRGEVAPNGVTTRLELEGPATTELDPRRWPPSAARDLVVDTIGEASLIEVATLRQVRHIRLVRRAETVVEVSLDEVAALGPDGPAVATRDELEAELKAGRENALAELAAALSTVDGVGPAFGSKLEFGLAARMER